MIMPEPRVDCGCSFSFAPAGGGLALPRICTTPGCTVCAKPMNARLRRSSSGSRAVLSPSRQRVGVWAYELSKKRIWAASSQRKKKNGHFLASAMGLSFVKKSNFGHGVAALHGGTRADHIKPTLDTREIAQVNLMPFVAPDPRMVGDIRNGILVDKKLMVCKVLFHHCVESRGLFLEARDCLGHFLVGA